MTVNSFSAKLPFNSDLQGKSGKIYPFYSYTFDCDLDLSAKNTPGLYYIAKIEGDTIIKRTVLKKTENLFQIRQNYHSLVPNTDNFSYLIYEGDNFNFEEIIEDVKDNGDVIFSILDDPSSKNCSMNLDELKNNIKNKIFKSTDGIDYQFIPENTLRIKNNPSTAVHYEVKQENGKLILHHNYLLGSEPIIIEILKNSNRLELSMSKAMSGEFIGTWIEQEF